MDLQLVLSDYISLFYMVIDYSENMVSAKDSVDFDKHIGSLLRMIRNLRGYSQAKVATAVGVTFQQLQKYETGANRLYVSRLIEICKFCNFDIVEFFRLLFNNIKNANTGDYSSGYGLSKTLKSMTEKYSFFEEYSGYGDDSLFEFISRFKKLKRQESKKIVISFIETLIELEK